MCARQNKIVIVIARVQVLHLKYRNKQYKVPRLIMFVATPNESGSVAYFTISRSH